MKPCDLPIQLVTSQDDANLRLVSHLEKLLVDAKDGRMKSLLSLVEYKTGYSFIRTNMSIETSLGFLARVSYRINREWYAL